MAEVFASDVNRLFLQATLSRGMMTKKLSKVIWKKCVDAVKAADNNVNVAYTDTEAAWNEFVTAINKSLNSLDLEFRNLQDQVTGTTMYALRKINLKGDDIAQMATEYSALEIAYFKAIVEQIMLAPHECYSLSSIAALREISSLKGPGAASFSKAQAEVVLGSFVTNGWLLKSARGRYSLSTRTLLELMNYLKETYPDEILECTVCMDIVTSGIACQRENCKARMHKFCFLNYRKRQQQCPTCTKPWPADLGEPGLLFVGEKAVKDGQDDRRVRIRRKSSSVPSDDEGEGGDAVDSPEPTQKLKRLFKKGKAKPDNSMDVDDDDDE